MSVKYKDYYEILGVDRKASQDEIARAFKKIARKFHPDLNPGDKAAEDKFKEANEAYEVLKDPEKRKRYDALGPNWQAGQDFQPPPGFENIRFDFQGGGFGGSGFSDFFEQMFGGGPGAGGYESFFGGRPSQRRGADAESRLDLTLEEAYRGGDKSITLAEQGPGGQPQIKTMQVKVPAGIKNGQRIRLRGQGNPGFGGGPAGDLYLKVRLLPHSLFKVEEANIIYDLPLAPWEAATGATVRVPTLDGTVQMNIPAGMSSGKKLRLRGKGLGSGAKRGDMFVRVMVTVPKAESEDVKKLWQELAEKTGFSPRND